MVSTKSTLNKIYDKLLETYSYQGWWPMINYDGVNPTKSGSVNGYHPHDYTFPRNDNEQFEIILYSLFIKTYNFLSNIF